MRFQHAWIERLFGWRSRRCGKITSRGFYVFSDVFVSINWLWVLHRCSLLILSPPLWKENCDLSQLMFGFVAPCCYFRRSLSYGFLPLRLRKALSFQPLSHFKPRCCGRSHPLRFHRRGFRMYYLSEPLAVLSFDFGNVAEWFILCSFAIAAAKSITLPIS